MRNGSLTAEERTAITELSRDLPAIWSAETTTNQERKQLLRMAIESVQVDGISQAGQIEVQIRWRSGTITSLQRKAGCTWRMLAENARRSRFPDSQNGAAAHLRRNRHGAQSCRPAQRLWPAFH